MLTCCRPDSRTSGSCPPLGGVHASSILSRCPSATVSRKVPVARVTVVVVFTLMVYGPDCGNTREMRAAHPGPPCMLPWNSVMPGPSSIRYGSKSSEARSMV